jgi:hypothetical protein
MRRHLSILSAAVLLASCGSDPVSYSAPVGISLDAKSADVTTGQVSADKNITTESGNPYGAFTNAAVQKLGRDPSRIAVNSATLVLESSSTGVTGLQQVFGEAATVSFQMSGTRRLYPAASVPGPSGAGPVSMVVAFDSTAMSQGDYADLVDGNFKVILGGPAAADFAAASATAKTRVTFTFVAYE